MRRSGGCASLVSTLHKLRLSGGLSKYSQALRKVVEVQVEALLAEEKGGQTDSQ